MALTEDNAVRRFWLMRTMRRPAKPSPHHGEVGVDLDRGRVAAERRPRPEARDDVRPED